MGFWKKLGRIASIAAPIVAAPFTGGASLALIGAGAGAANGALSGGGLKGALTGAALGGVTAGIGGGALNGAKGAAGAASKGIFSKVGSQLLANAPQIAGAAGAAMSGASEAAAHNRGVNVEAELAEQDRRLAQEHAYNNDVIAREQEGRASGTDALRKVMQTAYIQNATGYKPKDGLASYGFGPQAATDAEKQAAAGLQAEAMTRATGGNQIPEIAKLDPFTIDPKLLKQGLFEKVGNIAGPALSMYELLARQHQQAPTGLDPRNLEPHDGI